MSTELAKKTCVPWEGGIPPLTATEAAELLGHVDGWELVENHHLRKEYTFPDFIQGLAAVNRIGSLA